MKNFIFLTIFLLSNLISFGQSDGCSAATPISVTANCSSPMSGTTTGATQTISGCVGTADDDVWYSFVATGTTHDIIVDGAVGFDAVVQLFSGSCSSLISLGCMDQGLDGDVETIYASGLTPGATYHIRVYDYYAGSGTGNFTICVTPGTPPPSNDACSNSIGLTVNTSCSYTAGTSAGATQSLTGCAGTADDDVWFSFVATNSVQTITVDPSVNMDPVLQLYSGTCGTLSSLYCEDSGFTDGNEQIDAVGLTPGNTYYVRVYDYYSSTGGDAFNICVTGAATSAPPNDEPCNAIQIPSVTAACNYLNFTNVGATSSAGPPAPTGCLGGSTGTGGFSGTTADVWFAITVPSTGSIYVTSQPFYGLSDGVMALYSGTCGSLTQISCTDDWDGTYGAGNYPGAANDAKPYIEATGLTPNSTVYLRYWGYGSAQGDFGLCVTSPTNDDCANALYICDLNGYGASTSAAYTEDRPGGTTGTQMYGNGETTAGVYLGGTNTVHSGGPFGYPNGSSPSGYYDVTIDNNSWITFTASAATATLYVSIYDCWVGSYPSGGIQMQVFSGTNCDDFVSVSNFEESSTGFTITATGLTIGQDYYLMIDGYAGDICNYTITAQSGVAFPEIVASADPICAGGSTTLTAPSTATSYLWYPGGETTQSIVVNPSVTTTYQCVVEGVCGYKQTLDHTVNVNQLPTITNSATNYTCSDVALNLPIVSDLASTYSWYAANNGNVSGETTSTSTANTITDDLVNSTTAPQTVTYYVTPTSTAGCPGPEQTFDVVVNPLPSMINSSTQTICSGQNVNIPLQSNIAANYSWYADNNANVSGETTSTSTATSITDGLTNNTSSVQTVNYHVTPTSTSGSCAGTAQTVTITVNPKPVMTSASSKTICSGTSPSLALTSNMSASYSWVATPNTNVAGESTSTQTSSTITDILSTSTGSQEIVNYTVYSTATTGGCSGDPQTVAISVNPKPNMTSGNTDEICDGETMAFALTSDIASTFTWVATSNGNVGGESTTNQTGSTINNTLTNSTTSAQVVQYTVTPTATSGGCQGTAQTVSVTVNPTPDANAGSTATLLCSSPTVTLSGSSSTAGVNYSWSGPGTITNGTTLTPDVDATGTYTLTVTDPITTCFNTSTTTVNSDLNTPTVTAGSSSSVVDCNNLSVDLDGTGSSSGAGYTILWSTSDGNITGSTSSLITTADQDGTYILTITDDNNGCSDNTSITLTIDTVSPNVNAGTDQTLTCASPTLNLSGSSSTGGATFAWTGPSITSGANTATPTVNGTGIYTLVVTNPSNGCTAQDAVEIFADANTPDAQIGATTNLDCSTTTTTIAGSSTTSGVTYSWTASGGGNITGGASTATPTVNAPGTYSMLVTDPNNGCTNTANITITEDVTLPTVTASPSATTVDCTNPSITLDGTGSSSGAGYTITWSTSDGNITGATNNLITTADQDGTYTLTIDNAANGCSDFMDITLAIDTASPNAVAGGSVNFPCGVTTVALDGSASTGAGITYAWTGPGTITNAASATPDVDATGNYILTVTGANGCTDSDNVDVIPDSNAPVADAGADITVTCSSNNLPVTLDGSGSDSGANITYSWSTNGTGTITGGTTTTPSVDQEGAYTILVTNTSNNCTASATVNISTDTISPTADLSATSTSIITCTSNNQAILDATNSSGNNLTYNYTTSDGNIVSQSGATATVDASGTYIVTATGDNGCTDTQSILITVDTISPTIVINTPDTLNCNLTSTFIDASSSTSTSGTYAWTTTDGVIIAGANTSLLNSGGPGTYTLTLTNTNGCASSTDVTVMMAPAPFADFTASPTSGVIPLNVSTTNNSTGNNLTYYWDLGDGDTSALFEPTNVYNDMGAYEITLIVTDQYGCTDTTAVMIDASGEYSIIIPNIFTPNGDDNNDVFHFTLQNATELHCMIYNRWGQLMYEFEALDGGWDGRTYSGLEASEGGYYYLLWVTDFTGEVHDYQGPFELQR